MHLEEKGTNMLREDYATYIKKGTTLDLTL